MQQNTNMKIQTSAVNSKAFNLLIYAQLQMTNSQKKPQT